MKKRILSLLLAIVMVFGLIPTAFAASATEDTVYISVSYDGQYKTGSDGAAMAYVPVKLSELNEIDLDSYNMGDYKYDADGDGTYEITALHLFIYAHEKLMGLNWSDVEASGAAGSIFFGNGLFGFDYNLNYYYNGDYPIDEKMSADWGYTVGATADHIVLKQGDCMDIAGFSNESLMIYGATFRYFTDGSKVARTFSVPKGDALNVNLSTIGRDWSSSESTLIPETGSAVYYGRTAFAADAATVTTDDNGNASITFDEAGKWYIWSYGYNDGTVSCTPAYAEVNVTWKNTSDVTADWPNFRNSLYNMAITDAKTPSSAATTVEKWVGSYGSGWSATPSGMIIADNALIFMAGSSVKKVDLQTGELLAEGTTSASCGFAIISPTYGDGLIFCPLSGGKIEALDVKTLESVWVFSDTLGGQNNSPITYCDGYVYTGYWNGEEKEANYVCVNASTGELVWSKAVAGGFYWAGSTVVGDAVIFGSDDGTGGYEGDSHLFALNRLTGEVISDITLTGMGDQRSTIAYSAEKGRVYLTTKNGYIVSAAVDAQTGALSDLKSNKISSQATATPVVYGDKVYVGAGGGMQAGSTSGNLFAVDADSLEYLYEVPLQGYPQGSIMISTAYLAETGKLYCYATYNSQPGGMTLIKIDPNATTVDGIQLEEIFDAGDHPQYCLISPICGSDGTIYYRNDSGYIFALTSNNAYLTGLSANTGNFSEEFVSNKTEYELVVPQGTTSVTLTPTACEGGSAQAVTVTLVDGVATAEITVLKDGYSRTYTVSIREISSDATLSGLKVNESNTPTAETLPLNPEFSTDAHYYSMLVGTESKKWANVWPVVNDPNATVKIYALENVNPEEHEIAENGEITNFAPDSTFFKLYYTDKTKPMAVRIEVIAENGNVSNYYVVISKEAAAADGEALLETLKNCTHENATVSDAKDATCTEDGYTGDKTCPDCGTVISGTVIEALGHDYKDGICTRCNEADPDYKTAEGDVELYITIANKGNVVMFQQKIAVVDVNHNGIFDVDDALYAAHEAAYEGGAAAGYSSYESQWGLSIGMLWGDTSYCYGYWLNNASCWSLEDVVAEGNHLVAFVYTDSNYWSDSYSKFEKFDYTATAGEALTVSLEKAGYDENWNTVFSAHDGASITVYDSEGRALTEGYIVTDNGDGTYTITVSAEGSYYVVATDGEPILVPAVCELTVSKKAADMTDPTTPVDPNAPQTGDSTNMVLMVSILVISLCSMAALVVIHKKKFF